MSEDNKSMGGGMAKTPPQGAGAEGAGAAGMKGGMAGASGMQRPGSKAVVTVRSLHVRKDHSTTSESIAGLVEGNEVDVLETWSDGKDTWIRIGDGKWAAMEHNGQTMMKYK